LELKMFWSALPTKHMKLNAQQILMISLHFIHEVKKQHSITRLEMQI